MFLPLVDEQILTWPSILETRIHLCRSYSTIKAIYDLEILSLAISSSKSLLFVFWYRSAEGFIRWQCNTFLTLTVNQGKNRHTSSLCAKKAVLKLLAFGRWTIIRQSETLTISRKKLNTCWHDMVCYSAPRLVHYPPVSRTSSLTYQFTWN